MPFYRLKHGKVVERLSDEDPPGPSIDRHESYMWSSDQNVADFGDPVYGLGVYGEPHGAQCGACEVEEGMSKHGK